MKDVLNESGCKGRTATKSGAKSQDKERGEVQMQAPARWPWWPVSIIYPNCEFSSGNELCETSCRVSDLQDWKRGPCIL